ncbi:hypothetical protein LTR36_001962 [Oleoguttula mirabilis]|uniref:DNA (cytosine-5)-methyltransferase 1 replication foci domain-containing protein n=1 Tax=Oleoguttula mirabilis TaxID=1507867 RepID=A0AAV9JLQ7_9PEZI|nr:hypothetical protein LTR36_001962 [Oleoguttula mirabilis]
MSPEPSPETDVLAPLDPSVDTNPDDWPEYELHNARVLLPDVTDTTTNVSLLLATEYYPLTVVGQLRSVPQGLAHRYLGSSTKRSDTIEFRSVRSFAYGQYSDGSVALWAAGQAGWFALKPCRWYRDTYNGMVEAVKLLYFVADAYREPRKTGKGKHATILPAYTADELFAKYAADVLGDPDALDDAQQRIYGHRDFMFVSMLAGKEGVAWEDGNPLYEHLRMEFPHDHEAALRRLRGPAQRQKPARRRQSADTSSTTSSPKRKRGRPPVVAKRAADVISLDSSSAASSVAKQASQPKSATSSSKSSRSAPQATSLAVRRTRHTPAGLTTETGTETPTTVLEPTATPAIPEISDSEDELAAGRQAHKGKSALRPRPSKGAAAASNGGQGRAEIDEDDDDEGEGEAQQPHSSPIGTKRRADEPSTHHPRQHRQRKRRNSTQDVDDEGIDMPDSPSASEPLTPINADADADEATSAGAPHESAADLAVRLRHVPDPVQEDTYRCALAACTHKVYLASRPDSQRLIREHYALHAYDDDRRVQLVKTLQAPRLPTERLMEAVRARARIEGFPGSRVAGTRFPVGPIVQRY